ncbi:MAG: hypothetical protein ACU843_00925 [Gammaproteobacteria bacterium]
MNNAMQNLSGAIRAWRDAIGSCVTEAVHPVESICDAHGYEPSIALNCIAPRNVYVTAVVIHDRDVDRADQRASAGYEELFECLTAAGYPPYRLGTHGMASLPLSRDD